MMRKAVCSEISRPKVVQPSPMRPARILDLPRVRCSIAIRDKVISLDSDTSLRSGYITLLAKKLKLRVHDRQPTMGVLLSFDFWPGQLEMFKAEGLHFAVLDMEHSSCDLRTAEELCRTARLLDFPLLIRPEASVHYLVKKYVDMGAAGLMMPWMETEQQVNTLRDAVFTPPRGRRGPGGPSIFANRSLDRAGWDEIEASLFLMIQIESREGLAAVKRL